jgi:hypothetical protein
MSINFIKSIEDYCYDVDIDVEDYCTRNNYVVITGDISLGKIGDLYAYFKDEYKLIKIEFIDYQNNIYCFKISIS